MSHRKPILIAAAVVVAAALLIAPYVVRSPVAIMLGQEQAPEAPADEPAAPADQPAQPDQPAPSAEENGSGRSINLDLSLRSVRVWRVDLDDDEEELLLYTFNNDLQGILDEDGFVLLGPNSADEATSESALFIETDRKSVLVGYKSGTDVRSFTLGGVRSGAVSSLDGKVNLQDTAELAGSSAARFRGPTAGPDLLWVSVNRSNERIDYVFDENLDENASPDPSQFGYYTRNGIKHSGDRLISIEDRVVTIEFNKSSGDSVEDAVRYFVLGGAVKDLQGHENALRAVGRSTTKPDLSGVRRINDTMFEYTFDASVTEIKADEFMVYTATGAMFKGASYARPDTDTVLVIFPQLRYIGEQVVVAAVGGEAVKSAESITSRNTVGARTLSAAGRNDGGTAGPDLTSVDMDDDTGLVTYLFDEAIDRRIALDKIDARNFSIISASGDVQTGITVAAIGSNWLMILFNEDDVKDAAAASVSAKAVTDDEGNGNPIGSSLR